MLAFRSAKTVSERDTHFKATMSCFKHRSGCVAFADRSCRIPVGTLRDHSSE